VQDSNSSFAFSGDTASAPKLWQANELNALSHQPQICVSHLQPGEEDKIMKELRAVMPQRNIRSICSGDVLFL